MEKINGVELTPLKRILHEKGDLFHGLKYSEDSFSGFGEAYFSTVHQGDIKAWKLHKEMVLNLIVPVGAVRFVVLDPEGKNHFDTILSPDNYSRLTVQPGLWFGFQGIGENLNLVTNIASIEHDPDEVERKELNAFDYAW